MIALGVGVAYWFWVAVIGLIMAPFALTALVAGLYLIQLHTVERRVEKRFLASGWQPRPTPDPSSVPIPTNDPDGDVARLRAHLANHYGTSPHRPPRFLRTRRLIPRVAVVAVGVVAMAGLATFAIRHAPGIPQPPEWDAIYSQANE